MSRVFVSHPGLQHAHQLALALHERGLLQAFWSGVPVLAEGERLPFWLPGAYAKRVKSIAIPPELRRHQMVFPTLLRAAGLLPKLLSREDYTHRIFHLYDWWVSRQIPGFKPKVVVAFENSAYHTFKAAKAIGARCVLDAPALHHRTAAKILKTQPSPYLQEINRRKDEEVAMADLVLTCSPLAAESYLKEGVPAGKVRPIFPGATLPVNITPWQRHDLPLRFIFAGGLRYLKAIDLILKAFERIHAEGLPYWLGFAGGEVEPGWLKAIEKVPHTVYHGDLDQAGLFQRLAQADCLLLPSRFDSFGMVAAEAMACGTPVIVSEQTGSKAIIEQFPGAGWIVPCDEEALYRRVKALILDREALFAARDAALEAARCFSWENYRKRIGALIEEMSG